MAAPSKRSSRPAPVRKAWRSLTWLGVIIALLFGINAAGVIWGEGSWTPKLALDLEGGTQIILAPQVESGTSVSQEQLNQAVSIIRQRVDASGVAEAEINTEGENVVVRIPGELDDQTRARIEQSAKLELRAVLLADVASNQSIEPSASPSPDGAEEELESTPTAEPTDGSDPAWITPALQAEFDSYDCSQADENTEVAPADEPLVTCDRDRQIKYLLGPVEASGENIVDATNGTVQTQTGASTGQWAVNIVFDDEGTEDFAKVSTRLYGLQGQGQSPRDQFAFVLDGEVLTAPQMNGAITDGRPQITGNFSQESSKALADQLKFGALPISFTVQSAETISPTLGTSQLQSGLLAGLIGLILVVIYTLFQYRALGSVTIASLVIAAIITYLTITILSWREGYRLSLAGIAGLIVAIGFTADSFIVYFERVRDELRDGRPLVGAVEAGWKRAFRTVLASKGVNLLAAVVLFILAVGSVKGFAYTLGITTVIDVIVVILFTHPMLQLLAQTRFFSSGNPWSGLDPNALGAVYRGRAEFRKPTAAVAGKKAASSAKEAQRRQTIAERKAAAIGAGSSSGDTSNEGKES